MLHHNFCCVDAESAIGKVVVLLILLCDFFISCENHLLDTKPPPSGAQFHVDLNGFTT